MRLKLICLLLAGLGSSWSFSQEIDMIDSLTQTPQEQFEYITENLNLSPITTGLLDFKAFQLAPYLNFDGQHLADTNVASAFMFAKLYATLRCMAIDSTYWLPNPDTKYTYVLLLKMTAETT